MRAVRSLITASRKLRSFCGAPLLTLACLACAAPESPPPDIILISLDSVRSDVLTFDDAESSPALSQLASDGTRFRQAISGTSWTLPSHLQMMTGAPPVLHGVESDDLKIDPHRPTLAEELQKSGYLTAGFFTAGYLWGDYGFDRGFDVYRSAVAQAEVFGLGLGDDQSLTTRELHQQAGGYSVTAANVANEVEVLLGSIEEREAAPLFLFLHFFDPHYDYIPPAPYDTKFDPDYAGKIDGRRFWENPKIWDATRNPPRQISERDLEHIRALYRGEVAWVDSQLARIFAALHAAHRLDNALIVVTADHGEEFFDHGLRGHRHTLFDELLRVPLLIAPPGGRHVEAVEAQVTLSDIAPTILDYADVATPDAMHGRSLRPALEGKPFASRPEISTLYYPRVVKNHRLRHKLLQSIRTPDWKLLRSVVVTPEGVVKVPEAVYYDLKSDPLERNGIVDRSDPKLVEAWGEMEAELDAIRARWSRGEHVAPEQRTTAVRDQMAEHLEALGYVGAEPGEHPKLDLPWDLAPPPAVPLATNGTR